MQAILIKVPNIGTCEDALSTAKISIDHTCIHEFTHMHWRDDDGNSVDVHPSPICETKSLAGARPTTAVQYAALQPRNAEQLSILQWNTMRRALESLDQYRVFGLGDGTGVGKGRIIASIIFEWRLRFPQAPILWLTANRRLSGAALQELENLGFEANERFRFCSYAMLKIMREVEQTRAWMRSGTPPLLVFDECHILRSRQNQYHQCELLRHSSPNTCTVFSSATMMSDSDHVFYIAAPMRIYGTTGAPFSTAKDLHHAMRTGGQSFLELLTLHCAYRGMYVSRQLALDDVIVSVHTSTPSRDDRNAYDTLLDAFRTMNVSHLTRHRLCLHLVTSLKTKYAIDVAKKHLLTGVSVVFSVVHTGEAAAQRQRTNGSGDDRPIPTAVEYLEHIDADPALVDAVKNALPKDPIDQIIEAFGSHAVAELTGRKTRKVLNDDGRWVNECVNIRRESDAFQSGEKHIAILSKAGGVGSNLHDTGAGKRVHIVIEMPWSSEDLMQVIGRCHRSASLTSPEYALIVMDIPAEMRIAYTLTQRVKSMGSLTRADRGACDALQLAETFQLKSSASTRRTVAIRLALRQLTASLQEPLRGAVLEIAKSAVASHVKDVMRRRLKQNDDDMNTRRVLHDATVANRVLVMLMSVHQGLPVFAEEDLSSIRSYFPHDVSTETLSLIFMITGMLCGFPGVAAKDILVEWLPTNFHFYGRVDKAVVVTMLAVHAHPAAAKTIGMLPDALLFTIFEMFYDSHVHDLDITLQHISDQTIGKLHLMSHEAVMNAMVLMPMTAQAAMSRVLQDATLRVFDSTELWTRTLTPLAYRKRKEVGLSAHIERPMMSIVDVVSERCGDSALSVEWRSTTLRDEELGIYEVNISFHAHLVDVPSGGLYFRHRRSNKFCWRSVGDPNGSFINGDPVTIYDNDDGYFRVPETTFRKALARKATSLRQRRDAMLTRYIVSTSRALYDWETSLKCIVEFQLGSQQQPGTQRTGLLIRAEN